jgi:hypothetical protein
VTHLPTTAEERKLAKAQAKMAKARARMDLQGMSRRVERLRWRTLARAEADAPPEPRVRRPIRLWLPLTPFLILLSPLLLLALGIAVLLPRPLGVNPAHVVLGVGRMLMALNGTQVEVESPSASVLIKIL